MTSPDGLAAFIRTYLGTPTRTPTAADLRAAARGQQPATVDAQVQQRALANYDRMFGLDEVTA
ncbi:hypothetical protein [Plantactinospora sp. BB1]|uniref:hypothetical protein n=1 Tax=Plantactinospora sp. BB1 TaxID=2071627 RepID=UPI000D176A75|nr:hypothetical protein [Plantactinospora sp. BB1]AVT39616.1 hypothetical protein C6W10_27820 [Plantactinospora sp. BB1]